MEPLRLSQAIEENTIELFAWILLFPVTLIDLILSPIAFVDKMSTEMLKANESRFDARMPPVLFLLFGTVPLSIAIARTGPGSETMPSLTDAALMLALCIATFPFVWALSTLVARGHRFGRASFREAFGTQCYLFCPGWVSVLLIATASNEELLSSNIASLAAFVILLANLIWLLVTEWKLLMRGSSTIKAALSFAAAVTLSILAGPMLIALAEATGQKWLS